MRNVGIYAIRNMRDDKCYIGQSIQIKERKWQHYTLLKKSKHHCIHLQRAWNKFGESAFEHVVLEECKEEELTEREQYWMDITEKEKLYNHAPAAGSPRGIKRSKETTEKWRESRKGFKHSEETKAKMRIIQSSEKLIEARRIKIQEQRKDPKFIEACSRKGVKASEETKKKLSEGLKERWADSEYKLKLSAKQKEIQKQNSHEAAARMKSKWSDPEFREYMKQCKMKKKLSKSNFQGDTK